MSIESVIYLFTDYLPFQIGLFLTSLLVISLIFGERIITWYQFKFHDFGTCPKCFGKLDNMWYLTCTKCYSKIQNLREDAQ